VCFLILLSIPTFAIHFSLCLKSNIDSFDPRVRKFTREQDQISLVHEVEKEGVVARNNLLLQFCRHGNCSESCMRRGKY